MIFLTARCSPIADGDEMIITDCFPFAFGPSTFRLTLKRIATGLRAERKKVGNKLKEKIVILFNALGKEKPDAN